MMDTTVTWVMLGVYLALMLGIGIYAQRYNTSLRAFLTGSTSGIGPWAIAVGFAATAVSMSGWIGNSSLTYRGGASLLLLAPFQAFMAVVAFLGFGLILRNQARRLGVMSMPDYYAERYQIPWLRQLAAAIIIVFMIPYMIAIIKATAIGFQVLLGVNYSIGVLVTAVVVVLYMTVGGYLADLWTDLVQGWLMAIGMLLSLVIGFSLFGGVPQLFHKLGSMNPEYLRLPGPLGWGLLIGALFAFSVANYGQPQLIYRFLHFKDARTMKIACIVGFFFMLLFNWAMAFPGLYARGLGANVPPDMATLTFVNKFTHPVFAAFFLTAGVAATMSTLDGVLLVVSTAFARDFYQKVINPRATQESMLKLAQVTTFVIGLLAVLLSLNPPDLLVLFTIFSFSVCSSSFVPVLLAGVWFKRTTPAGAVSAMVIGCITCLAYYAAGQPWLRVGVHPSILGTGIGTIVIIVVSAFTKPMDQPFLSYIFPPKPAKAMRPVPGLR